MQSGNGYVLVDILESAVICRAWFLSVYIWFVQSQLHDFFPKIQIQVFKAVLGLPCLLLIILICGVILFTLSTHVTHCPTQYNLCINRIDCPDVLDIPSHNSDSPSYQLRCLSCLTSFFFPISSNGLEWCRSLFHLRLGELRLRRKKQSMQGCQIDQRLSCNLKLNFPCPGLCFSLYAWQMTARERERYCWLREGAACKLKCLNCSLPRDYSLTEWYPLMWMKRVLPVWDVVGDAQHHCHGNWGSL